MKNPENRKKSVHRIYRMLLIFLTLLAVLVPAVFTAVQMGVFAKEPVLETKPMTTDPNAPLLRVATDYDFCPNSYINQKGDLSGLYIEIITEAANRLGMRLEFKTGTWMECRAMLENKSADVLLGLEIFSNTVRLTFDRNPGPKPRPSREAAPADISGMRVLVAEDNALNLEIAQTMLEEAGARVTTAVNGALAVECFREANPGTFDAILMDIMMPVMDGLAATRAIRSLPREDAATVPIIAITAKAFTEDREKVFDAGMNEYLTKPIDFAKLHTVLAGYRK